MNATSQLGVLQLHIYSVTKFEIHSQTLISLSLSLCLSFSSHCASSAEVMSTAIVGWCLWTGRISDEVSP